MKRNSVLGKLVILGIIGAFAALTLATPAPAQMAQEMKDAAKMMQDGWKMYNDGQRMVIQGKEMNDLVAAQGGFDNLMAPGNKVIQDGRSTATQAATLFAQGEKVYMDNQANPSVAKQGFKMMSDAFKMATNAGDMINQGVAMNDQVAQSKGAADKFAQGDNVIQQGKATMAQGAKLFMRGEAICQINK